MGRSPQRYPTTTKVESHEAWREHLAVSPATSPQAIPMAAHAEHTVHPRQPDCHTLMASVTGPAAPAHPAYEVARPWWRRLWALGAARRRRCVVPRAALRPAEPLTAPDGRRRTSQAQRPPPASAGCGPGRVGRQDGPGPPHPTQPAAVVTGLSPSAPDPRTPPAVGAALLQEPARPVRAAPPRPSGPARHAPLEGPAVAMTRRVPRGARRDARSIPPP